ncbi:unnamed protein product [Urochloa decumbens]|uniref:NB-ARC domain-containing protein n=1 Tax=Urochloa decumbens TaxID=240449 RepID=A0ABC8VJB2_9POAL
MGKTTLAQFICQDKMVKKHFGNKIIWVHVSKRFEPKVLMRRILKSINPDKACAEALDSLQSDLTEQLVTTKFLLVLDDAWEDMDNRKWEQFLDPLKNNAVMGSRILLTTRMKSVAQAVELQMRVGFKCFELKGLDQENTLKLFNHHAFGNSTPSDRSDLQLIGEQIARKLKGCPFLAKIVGQQMCDNTDRSRWNTILNQDICHFDEIGPTIMEMLKMSYQNLTYEVQICFRYCSIFPPGFKFKMEELIEMWVGSGLILEQENGIKNQEDIARDHFNILARKSFFSLVPRELLPDPSEDYYVMHDLMYELAHSVSIEECSRLKDGDHSAETHRISPTKVRHLYIQSITSEIIAIISQSKNLRTLIIENEANSIQQELMPDLKKSIKGRTSLRLLKLDGQGWFGMNDVVAELKHLRYIYMSATDEPNLCKLFKLRHLQVLRIIKIDKEEEMSPIDIGNLPRLQKLDLPKRALSTTPHIGKLTGLRELSGFSVRKKDGHNITELQSLGKLQKIIVLDVQNVSNCNEADAAKFDKKSDMKVLSLGWSDGQAGIDDHILNKLVPHTNLKHLTISQYNGIMPPIWIQIRHLSNLVRLELDGCIEWDKLPPLGNLGAVEHVVLANLPKLKYIGNSNAWTEGNGPRELPPHLVTFVVKDCPQLFELPDVPFSLQLLAIDGVGMSSLPAMSDLKRLQPQLSTLDIRSCDCLVSLNGCFLQEEHYKALTALKLFQCHTLSSLPNADDFRRISKMTIIEIIDCNSLLSLGGIGALSCLQLLKIENCCNLIISSSPRLPPASVEISHLQLETLEIDNDQLLDLNPLRNLCHTKRLIISDGSKMDLLPEQWLLNNMSHMEHIEISNAELLQSLPSKMQDLCALRSFLLHNAHALQSLPPHMPPKLWVLVINGCCAELFERCQVGGLDWRKINLISNRDISETA